MSKIKKMTCKPWPKNCVWPEPVDPRYGFAWDEDMVDPFSVNEEVEDLLEIKEYYDSLIEVGILDDEYNFDNDSDLNDDWEPELGEDFWFEDHFDYEYWCDELSEAMNRLKITDLRRDKIRDEDVPASIERITDYRFINENLLRQAFTRRAFAIEYGISGEINRQCEAHAGCSEELEFLGDSILNMIITKEILKHHTVQDDSYTDAPFRTRYGEGIFSKMRSRYTCKEHLAKRAVELGLNRYVLYGTGEIESESALEDMMEALIGAVAIDSNWDMEILEKLVDHLIELQIECPDSFIRKDYYNILNNWHQKNLGELPNYEVHGRNGEYHAVLRYHVPENDKGVSTAQLLTAEGATRSAARSKVAEKAYYFLVKHGLWMNLSDAGIVPDEENSIGQLQELYQKKYISEAPVYEFSEGIADDWFCDCYFESFHGYGQGTSKVKAKKKAAYMVLERMYVRGQTP